MVQAVSILSWKFQLRFDNAPFREELLTRVFNTHFCCGRNSRRSNVFNELVLQTRSRTNSLVVVDAMSRGVEDVDLSAPSFKDFTIFAETCESNEIKMRFDIKGVKTQQIFDDVFSKLVAAAQPIPGFRRVKGGKTLDVPKDVLLQILGPSRVRKEVIQKLINSVVSEYVEKEGLKVSKDLRVEQSYADLDASFDPGKEFAFDVVLQLQQ